MVLQQLTDWREISRKSFTSWETLADFLVLDAAQRQRLLPHSSFPLKLPLRLANKIVKGTLDDPILRQFLPTVEEQVEKEGFSGDPVGDCASRKGDKLLHKYEGRALLMPTSVCAMHCRYCFRRHFDYVSSGDDEEELHYIEGDTSIKEVILSGGDPLSLSNARLGRLLERLAVIPHLRKLRFHSRFPIGIPERIDHDFLSLIANFPLQVIFVLHSNHPKELDEELFAWIRPLQKLGVVLLNQTVLLHGVNDDVPTLKALFEELTDHGVLPYYLHQLDRVAGGAHFEVDESVGMALIEELSAQLPGYALPRYVREVAGDTGKRPLINKEEEWIQ